MVANAVSTILDRMIEPQSPNLTPDAARALLSIQFPDAERIRMSKLVEKAGLGSLNAAEKEELDGYMEVGLLIDLLQSKARLSLKRHV
jgi:hypothetical protein